MAYSKDCGKWPSVSPCSARSASASGPAQPGLERRGHRDRVDGEQPLHPDQVEADDPGVPVAAGDQPTDHRRPAAERHDGDPVPRRDLEQCLHLVVVARAHDRVGRVG